MKDSAQLISYYLDIPYVISRILVNRGIKDPDEARRFLFDVSSFLYDPFLFSDMEKAVARILKALKNGENILIFGDYDADGITASAILYSFLRKHTDRVFVFIPDRIKHGYGLKFPALADAMTYGCSLVIAVDCGTNSVSEIAYLKGKGIDVIVVDHHEPSVFSPPAFAMLNPKCDDGYPFDGLAGVGVVMKLVEALAESIYGEGARREIVKEYIPLVAVGTVADVMELLNENRFFVKYGMKLLKNNAAFRALCEVSNISADSINVYSISHILSPRINAAGRVGNVMDAFYMFVESDEDKIIERARLLSRYNSKRQRIEEKVLKEAIGHVDDKSPVVVVWSDEWHPGVIGIVASKLAELFKKPAFVITFYGGIGRGSARSYGEVDVYKMLLRVKDLLISWGGHKRACGFVIDRKNITDFCNRLISSFKAKEDLKKDMGYDVEIDFFDIDAEFLRLYKKLEPFGEGFPEPVFLFKDIKLRYARKLSKDVISFLAVKDNVGVDSILFGYNGVVPRNCDIAAAIDISEYNGRKRLRLIVKQFLGTNNG